MKKYELLTVVGKTMERMGMDDQLIKGLGLEFHMTMKDTMSDEVVKDEKEIMTMLSGLMGDDPRYVYYWIGIAIKTLAMSSES